MGGAIRLKDTAAGNPCIQMAYQWRCLQEQRVAAGAEVQCTDEYGR